MNLMIYLWTTIFPEVKRDFVLITWKMMKSLRKEGGRRSEGEGVELGANRLGSAVCKDTLWPIRGTIMVATLKTHCTANCSGRPLHSLPLQSHCCSSEGSSHESSSESFISKSRCSDSDTDPVGGKSLTFRTVWHCINQHRGDILFFSLRMSLHHCMHSLSFISGFYYCLVSM